MNLIPVLVAAALTASGHVGLTQHQSVDVRSLPDKISVRAHQALTFTFEQRGDRLVNPRPGRDSRKQPTVTVELTEESGTTILLVTSTYPKVLQYRGAARLRGQTGFVVSSAYPVHPGAPDAQAFQSQVDEVVLWDLRLIK
jgi:hypothetical protein